MPRLPRDIDGQRLILLLQKLKYSVVRQTGSHTRLTCNTEFAEHHITVPLHSPLKIGTLNSILNDIADFHSLSKDQLVLILFG